MKPNRKFSDLIKESFFDKKEFNSMDDIFKFKSTYKGDVAWCVNDIMMNEKHISEKSFKLLDELKINIEEKFKDNEQAIEALVKDCEEKGYRKQYTAEIIYNDFFK